MPQPKRPISGSTGKPKTTERNAIFGNKTADHESTKLGSGQQTSVLPRTSEFGHSPGLVSYWNNSIHVA